MVMTEAEAARARVTTAELPPPSSAMAAADAVAIGAALEEVRHAAEVAFALFAYVAERELGWWGDVGVMQGGGDGEKGGEASGVVADAGGVDSGVSFSSVGSMGWRREDGVEVGGEEDDRE